MDLKLRDEPARVAALSRYEVAGTGEEDSFVNITQLARAALKVPMAAVTLVDEQNITYKAAIGLDGSGNHRRDSFCNQTIRQREPLVISDARTDPRFSGNPYGSACL